ncbi:MAG: RHS repeat-associated core domain-containing protein [Myxococcota bacterium]
MTGRVLLLAWVAACHTPSSKPNGPESLDTGSMDEARTHALAGPVDPTGALPALTGSLDSEDTGGGCTTLLEAGWTEDVFSGTFVADQDGLYRFQVERSDVLLTLMDRCGGDELVEAETGEAIELRLLAGEPIVVRTSETTGLWVEAVEHAPLTVPEVTERVERISTGGRTCVTPETVVSELSWTLRGDAGDQNLLGMTSACSGEVVDAIVFDAPRAGEYVFDTAGTEFPSGVSAHPDACTDELACSEWGFGAEADDGSLQLSLDKGQRIVLAIHRQDQPSARDGDGYLLNIDLLADREQDCLLHRDADGDGDIGCQDFDCTAEPQCAAERSYAESADPSCLGSAACRKDWSAARRGRVAARELADLGRIQDKRRKAGVERKTQVSQQTPPNSPEGDPPTPPTPNGSHTYAKVLSWAGPDRAAPEPEWVIDDYAAMYMGGYPISMAFEFPPAPNDLSPSVTVNHNHRSGSREVGQAFSLTVPGPVLRTSEDGQPANHTATDRYTFDGVEFVPTSRGYEPRRRDGRVAVHDTQDNSWVLYYPSGTQTIYGTMSVGGPTRGAKVSLYEHGGRVQPDNGIYPTDAAMDDSFDDCDRYDGELCNTVAWYPAVTLDPFGNAIQYYWRKAALPNSTPSTDAYWWSDSRTHVIDHIQYGENLRERVQFEWQTRDTQRLSFSLGVPQYRTERLQAIEATSDGVFFSRYEFSYTGDDYLDRVEQTGPGGNPRQLVQSFEYSPSEPVTYGTAQSFGGAPFDLDQSTDFDFQTWNDEEHWAALHVVDLNGDALDDLIVEWHDRAATNGADHFQGYTGTYGGFSAWSGDAEYKLNELTTGLKADIDGDGCADTIDVETNTWTNCENEDHPLGFDDILWSDWETETGFTYAATGEFAHRPWHLVDVNSDGLADLVLNTFMRWEEATTCENLTACDRWLPRSHDPQGGDPSALTNAIVSRIYWGDGYGGFVDSGLEAGGPPLLMEAPRPANDATVERDRTLYSFWSLIPLNRRFRHLVASRAPSPGGGSFDLGFSQYEGEFSGFALSPYQVTLTEAMGDGIADVQHTHDYQAPSQVLGIDRTHQGDSCHEEGKLVAFGDFDGDGFADLVQLDTTARGVPDLSVRHSELTKVPGRLSKITYPNGGTVDLTWGFSASPTHSNPDLRQNLEVLESVTGPKGTVELRYGKGYTGPDGFGGFGVVEVKQRGILERFGYFTTPALAGQSLFRARYRSDGSLEQAEVSVYGTEPANGPRFLSINHDSAGDGESFFNPLVRFCQFENADETRDVDELMEFCWGIGLDNDYQPSRSSIYAVAGLWPAPPEAENPSSTDPAALAAAAWDRQRVDLNHLEQEGFENRFVVDGDSSWLPTGLTFADLANPAPDDVSYAALRSTESYENQRPTEAASDNSTTAYVTSYSYDAAIQRPTWEYQYRDWLTDDDDGTTETIFGAVGHADWPFLFRLETKRNYYGIGPVAPRSSSSWSGWSANSAFSRPTFETNCGKVPGSCSQVTRSFASNGEPTGETRHYADTPSPTYTRTFTDWCRDLTITNPVGEQTVVTMDGRCRPTRMVDGAGETGLDYLDTFGTDVREEKLSGAPLEPGMPAGTVHIRTTSSPSESRIFNETLGVLTTERLDGYGRPIAVERCASSNGHSCSGPMTSAYRGYSTDGDLVISAPPAFAGEPVVATRSTFDGAGREIIRDDPAANADMPIEYVPTYTYHWPGRTIDRGVVSVSDTVVSRIEWSTMGSSTWVENDLVHQSIDNADGQPIEKTEDGITAVFGYDASGLLSRKSMADSATSVRPDDTLAPMQWEQRFEYNDAGQVKAIIQPDNTRVASLYDAMGRNLEQVIYDDVGVLVATLSSTTYSRDAAGRQVEFHTDISGGWTETTFDGQGRVIRKKNSLDHVTLFHAPVAGGNGRAIHRTIRLDGALELEEERVLDAFGNDVEAAVPGQGTTTRTFDGQGRLLTEVDADGARLVWNPVYAHNGELLQEQLGDWVTARHEYDLSGRLTRSETVDGVVTLDYDHLDRIVQRRYGNPSSPDQSEHFTYDGTSERITGTAIHASGQPQSRQYQVEFDSWGRAWRTVGPTGVENFTYLDVMGRPRIAEDGTGYQRITRYDELGEVVFAESAGRNTLATQRVRSAGQTEVITTHADGTQERVELDFLGRPVLQLDAAGASRTFTYDGTRLVSTQMQGSNGDTVRMEFGYDAHGRQNLEEGPFDPTVANPLKPRTTYTYTAAGRQDTVSSDGMETDFDYGTLDGLPTFESYFGLEQETTYTSTTWGLGPQVDVVEVRPTGTTDERTTTFDYDHRGRVTSTLVQVPNGDSVLQTSQFDDWGQLASTRAETTTSGVTDTVETSLTYDTLGRLTRRRLRVNGTNEGMTRFGYLDNNQLSYYITPSGERIDYNYGPTFDHEIDSITHDGAVLFTVLTRDNVGRPLTVELDSGNVATQTYDAVGRPIERIERNGAQVEKRVLMAYDGLGRPISEAQTILGQTHTNTYTYYGPGYLKREVVGVDGSIHEYTVDAAGQRTATDVTVGGVTTTTNLTYANGLLATVGGNPIVRDPWLGIVNNHDGTTIERDASGAVRRITRGLLGLELLRDAQGLPVGRTVGSFGQRISHWNPGNHGAPPLEESLPSGQSLAFVEGPGATQRLLFNAAGTLMQSATLDYDASGSAASEDLSVVHHGTVFGAGGTAVPTTEDIISFAGMQAVPGSSSLHLARHRLYDAQTGQFASPDPIGLAGGRHRLLYANANPVQFQDPIGWTAEPFEAFCEEGPNPNAAVEEREPVRRGFGAATVEPPEPVESPSVEEMIGMPAAELPNAPLSFTRPIPMHCSPWSVGCKAENRRRKADWEAKTYVKPDAKARSEARTAARVNRVIERRIARADVRAERRHKPRKARAEKKVEGWSDAKVAAKKAKLEARLEAGTLGTRGQYLLAGAQAKWLENVKQAYETVMWHNVLAAMLPSSSALSQALTEAIEAKAMGPTEIVNQYRWNSPDFSGGGEADAFEGHIGFSDPIAVEVEEVAYLGLTGNATDNTFFGPMDIMVGETPSIWLPPRTYLGILIQLSQVEGIEGLVYDRYGDKDWPLFTEEEAEIIERLEELGSHPFDLEGGDYYVYYHCCDDLDRPTYWGITSRIGWRVSEHKADWSKPGPWMIIATYPVSERTALTIEAKMIRLRIREAIAAGFTTENHSVRHQLIAAGLLNKDRGLDPSKWNSATLLHVQWKQGPVFNISNPQWDLIDD